MRGIIAGGLLVALLPGCGRVEAPPSMDPAMADAVQSPGNVKTLQPASIWMLQAGSPSSLSCFVDVIEGAKRDPATWIVTSGGALHLRGWAVDNTVAAQRPAHLILRGDGGMAWSVSALRSPRDDVSAAERFVSLKPTDPGIEVAVPLTSLTPGRYALSYVVGDEEDAASCTLGPSNDLVVQ